VDNEQKDIIKEGYLRVTTIISPFTGIEFVPKEILEPACSRGTAVHKHIEAILSGWDLHVQDDVVKPYVQSFRKFWESSKHAFDGKITLEKRFYCDEHKITGQVDVMIETEDRTYLIDWKTSSSFQKSFYLQGAVYRYLCEVNGYKKVDNVLFVKLNKEGKAPCPYKSDDHAGNLDIFFKCLELFKYFKMEKTRNKWER